MVKTGKQKTQILRDRDRDRDTGRVTPHGNAKINIPWP
jgi:hypothetical protein